jgi:hypothetical protein
MVENKKVTIEGIDYEIDTSSSINYTNTKGFYEFITKLMIVTSKARIMGDTLMWLDCIDTLYSFTRPWWRDPKAVENFEAKYVKINQLLNSENKAFNTNIKGNVAFKVKGLLRDMNILVMDNTKHIMIRDDANIDAEDEDMFNDD